jgi:hypothetical protein
MERVRVAGDNRGFVLEPSGRKFVPWGFNYDHDEAGRLLEDYWREEWGKVEEDFREMKALGANVVRIHLQLGRFLPERGKPAAAALERLDRLLDLARASGLYLDLTGLGCYHKQEVPAWYDALTERERWEAQAAFWEAVALRAKGSPAVFCYDLVNEPVVPGKGRRDDWLGPPFAGKHFVQFITLDLGDRERPAVAAEWVKRLAAAIRKHDPARLITVGLVPWSLERPGLTSGFVPERIAEDLDFLSVHIYPERGKLEEALETLAGFAVGKPVVIEEMFPLHSSPEDLERFIARSREKAAGWIGFYWGKTPDECRASKEIADHLTLGWLELFQKGAPPGAD